MKGRPSHMHENLPDPGIDELHQEPSAPIVVPVRLAAPGAVHQLPARAGSYRSILIGDTPEVIAPADPRRVKLILYSATEPVFVGTDRASVSSGSAAYFPADRITPPLGYAGLIYARSATPGATTRLTVVLEAWAD